MSDKNNYLWIGIAVIAILIIIFISNSNNNSQNKVNCNSPYIQIGTSCCLDKNSNNICDNNEIPTQQEETKTECYITTWGNFSTACYDNRGDEPYVSTAYCNGDVEMFEDYTCKNNLCEKSIRRQDCNKDLADVKDWTCIESNNPSQDGWMVTCTPK